MFGPLLWSLLNTAATILTPFVLFTILARTAEAWQVGAIGIAISLLEILKACSPQGLYEILLRPDIRPEQQRSALGYLMACGIVGAALYCVLVLTASYAIPDFEHILPALFMLAPKLIFDVAALQPQAEVARQQALRRLAMRTIVANGVAATTGGILAFSGQALLGLVAYYVIQSVLGFVLVYRGQTNPAVPSLELAPLAGLLKEAGYASGVRLVAASNNYADTLIVAAFVPPAVVGAYNLAKRIETTLMGGASSFGTMLFQPSYAKGNDIQYFDTTETSLKVTTLLFGIPVVVFVSFNRDWIGWVFGEKWIAAGPICALLALSGLARTYGSIHGSLLSVSGRNRALLKNSVASAVSGVFIVASLANVGLFWVALALAIKSTFFSANLARLTIKNHTTIVKSYSRHVLYPLAATAVLANIATLASNIPGSATGSQQQRVTAVAFCALLTFGLVAILYRRTIQSLYHRLKS